MMAKRSKVDKKIIIVVMMLIALIGVLAAFIFLKDDKNGKYVEESYNQNGIEFYIEIHNDSFAMTLKSSEDNEQTVTGTITMDGSKIILEAADEKLEGTYDEDTNTIHVAGYTFTKEN